MLGLFNICQNERPLQKKSGYQIRESQTFMGRGTTRNSWLEPRKRKKKKGITIVTLMNMEEIFRSRRGDLIQSNMDKYKG